jgi:hypothetical protein
MVRGKPAPGLKTLLKRAAIVVAAGLVLAQLVRPDRTNPPTDPTRTLAATTHPPANVLAILDRGCRDCHTNDTVWPWYTNVAPISWFIVGHVNEGRHEMNLSNWAGYDKTLRGKRLAQMCDLVQREEMPLSSYLLLHRDSRLSDEDRQAICDWTDAQAGQ